MSENGLPPGWSVARLEDVAEIVMGQSPPSSAYNEEGRGLPFFQGKAEFTELFPAVRKWCSAPTKVAEPNDILLSVRAPVGPTNLAQTRSCIGRGLAAVRVLEGIEYRYVLYAMRASVSRLAERATGSTFEAVSGSVVRGFEVAISPTKEQRRIVAAIEEQFARLDAGVAALEQTRANLKRYRASVLKAAVEGRLTERWREENPDVEDAMTLLQRILEERRARWEEAQLARYAAKGQNPPKNWRSKYKDPAIADAGNLVELPKRWAWTTVDQLTFVVRNGLSKKPAPTPPGHRILRINAVRPMRVNMGEVRYIDLTMEEVESHFLHDGDILFTRYNGSVDLLGVAGMVRACSEPTLHPDKLIRARMLPGAMAAYAELACNTGASRAHVERRARTTAGQTGISGADVKQIPIPLPPLTEQEEIVAEVERRLSVAEGVEAQVEAGLKRAARLRQAILKRAFEGRLVPQDPEDEPAEVLLDRIRAERAAVTAKPKRKGRARTARPARTGGGQPGLF